MGGAGRYVVLYDADCPVCRALLVWLLRRDPAHRLEPLALQTPEAADLLADLTPAERMASWHLVEPSGKRFSGGAALAPVLSLLPGWGVPAAVLERLPWLADRGYGLVAAHRSTLSAALRATRRRGTGP
jgi:predicted DCC family thiol-disulfide oxidoreductase YuxK